MDRPAISTGPALMIPAGYPRDLPSALLRAARDFGGAGVVEIGPDGRETKLDFPTLLELAARILAGLRANGVRAGDPAVVHCTEPVGFFASFWACTLGGIRPLLMAPSADGDRTEEGRERLRKVTDLLDWTVLIGRPSDLPNDLGLPVLDPDALAGHEPTSEFHRPAADDVAVLMMSSGTSTGTPKIVQLTHRGLVEFAAGTPAMLPVRPGQTTLNWLPLDQSGAFLLYHLLPVFTGCTNIHVNTRWVLDNPQLRIISPLLQLDRLVGFAVLYDPPPPFELTYEDRDLLKTLGRHVATHIAQQDADRRLAESRQFEAYNRLTAFMMHDLKNSVAQLKLIVTNAQRHRHNPEFIDDAIGTIANTAERMTKLIEQLRGSTSADHHVTADLRELARTAVARCSYRSPVPVLEPGPPVMVIANAERLSVVIEHIVRNAQDATSENGKVSVSVGQTGREAQLLVEDSGAGMDADFLRNRLFRPFDSTKGSKGMGIGAYQVREYIRVLGGDVEVQSSPGQGTRFAVSLPVSGQATDAPSAASAAKAVAT